MSLPGVRKLKIAAAVAALALSPFVHGSDAPVVVKGDLKGAWMQPDGAWDGRTVLALHGFADDMDGAGDLAKHLMERLAANGIASLRINFRGEGDRHRTVIESTFDTRIEDTESAYEFLSRRHGVKIDRLGCFGWSLGSATELEVMGRHPMWFRSGAVWSSPTGSLEKLMMGLPGAEEAVRAGVSTYDAGWKKITTYRAFYLSFKGIDLDKSVAKYPGALLAVRGTMDFVPNGDPDLMKAATGEPREAVLIGGADHIFNVFEPGKGHAERAIQVTTDWFVRTL
ncbi:MAG TPA: alpha/beta hydrolase [Opitutaceae bacterium]